MCVSSVWQLGLERLDSFIPSDHKGPRGRGRKSGAICVEQPDENFEYLDLDWKREIRGKERRGGIRWVEWMGRKRKRRCNLERTQVEKCCHSLPYYITLILLSIPWISIEGGRSASEFPRPRSWRGTDPEMIDSICLDKYTCVYVHLDNMIENSIKERTPQNVDTIQTEISHSVNAISNISTAGRWSFPSFFQGRETSQSNKCTI